MLSSPTRPQENSPPSRKREKEGGKGFRPNKPRVTKNGALGAKIRDIQKPFVKGNGKSWQKTRHKKTREKKEVGSGMLVGRTQKKVKLILETKEGGPGAKGTVRRKKKHGEFVVRGRASNAQWALSGKQLVWKTNQRRDLAKIQNRHPHKEPGKKGGERKTQEHFHPE